MRVLFFGTYDDRAHPRVRVLQEGLAAAGESVDACNVPLALGTAARVRILRRPWRATALAWRIAASWLRLSIMGRRLTDPDVVLVGYLGHFDVLLARRLWKRAILVLDYLISLRDTALDRGASSKLLLRVLGWIDAWALKTADISIVDTHEHLLLLEEEARRRAVVVPVGAPEAWFASPEPSREGPIRVIFFGLYTPLQGAPTIGKALALLTDEPMVITMVGRGQQFDSAYQSASRNPNVSWFPWVPSAQLPSLVASHDVCLGIFGTGSKAFRVVPNKVFQGAAAGCAIITSDTPPQRRALGESATFVPAGDPSALAEALIEFACVPERLWKARQAAHQHALRFFRPEIVTQELREHLRANT